MFRNLPSRVVLKFVSMKWNNLYSTHFEFKFKLHLNLSSLLAILQSLVAIRKLFQNGFVLLTFFSVRFSLIEQFITENLNLIRR